jgi:hypothetical protein
MSETYPHGKKYPDDQGELEIRIAADHSTGCVRIDFGKPIVWLALEPAEAVDFASRILAKAFALRK